MIEGIHLGLVLLQGVSVRGALAKLLVISAGGTAGPVLVVVAGADGGGGKVGSPLTPGQRNPLG